jgi:hypothetical protein
VRPAPKLEAITPNIFENHPALTRDELSAWVESWLVADTHHTAVQSLFVERVEPWLSAGRVLRLPNLRETAEQDWGWVVGQPVSTSSY